MPPRDKTHLEARLKEISSKPAWPLVNVYEASGTRIQKACPMDRY